MSDLPKAVAEELAKQEEAKRRKSRANHAEEQRRASEARRLRREMESERPSKAYAHLAIARNATQANGEKITLIAPKPENETAEFNYTTDAASLLLSFYQMSPRLRGYVDAICGLAGNSEDWFEAPDVKIAKRMGRSTKTIQRDRDDLVAWQKEKNVTFIEIEDHYTDRKGVRHPHKYRVHLARLAVKAKFLAQSSNKWQSDPVKATEQAVKMLGSEVPEMPPRKEHRRREPGLEQIIESDLRRAGNLMLKTARNLKSAEMIKLSRGYMRGITVKPELIKAVEHSLAVLKGEAEPDAEIIAPLDTRPIGHRASGQSVRKETIQSKIADVAVIPEMPSDVPISEYLRVPSILRAMYETREHQKGLSEEIP